MVMILRMAFKVKLLLLFLIAFLPFSYGAIPDLRNKISILKSDGLTTPLLVGGQYDYLGNFNSVLVFSAVDVKLSGRCSGTKVGKNLVLTAAHCFMEELAEGKEPIVQRNVAVDKIFYSFSPLVLSQWQVQEISVNRVIFHPELEHCFSKSNRASPKCVERYPDLAIVEVEQNEDFEKEQSVPVDFNFVNENDPIVMVGYGAQANHDQSPPVRKFHRSEVVSVETLAENHGGVSPKELKIYKELYFGTFGLLLGENYANLGAGDSGGPVFKEISGNLKLVGVNSFSYCQNEETECEVTSNSYFARVHTGGSHRLGEWLSGLLDRVY